MVSFANEFLESVFCSLYFSIKRLGRVPESRTTITLSSSEQTIDTDVLYFSASSLELGLFMDLELCNEVQYHCTRHRGIMVPELVPEKKYKHNYYSTT